ncbi:MAG: DUF72 domain-containing protein, partial [Planctomycetota bacterium]
MGTIHFGTAGWSYPDWKGVVYPREGGRGFDALAYLAGVFDVVEINSSFYRPPTSDQARAWLQRTASVPEFLFTLKLHRRFTHDRKEPWTPSDTGTFREGIDPIAQAGKLGALLLQFPWSFRNIEGNRRWLSKLAKDFAPYPLVVELRHASWLREAAFRFLESLSLAFCNIDQPEMRDSIGPSSRVTAGVGYVRFHGRNREAWFRKDAGRDER